jgi:hypothetical protein
MDRVVKRLQRDIECQTSHSFVITQNVHDDVWLEGPTGQPTTFSNALGRRWSTPNDDRERVLVRYSISQGIILYHNGRRVVDRNDPLIADFTARTNLEDMLWMPDLTAEDAPRRIVEPAVSLPCLYAFIRRPDSVNSLLIDNLEYLIDCGGSGHGNQLSDRVVLDMLVSWTKDIMLRREQAALIMLCSNIGDIPDDLIRRDGGFTIVPATYPTRDERQVFLEERGVVDASRLANLTTGFRRFDLNQVVTRQMSDDEIAARKAELIVARCGDVVELVTADYGLDRSNAQPHVRDYLIDLSSTMAADRKDTTVPMGLLFVGVPGNGKSHIARAFAHDCGMNMLRFKNLRSMWVGESERNLESVLDLLPSLAPSVVFIDEVDQMLGSRSAQASHGDGGVESRILGRLLDFMGNSAHRGDILWIGATNRPDLLDIAALRRFDRIFPFMNPNSEARAYLVEDLITRLNIPTASTWNKEAVASLMDEFSCDEVEKVLRRAFELSKRAGQDAVALSHVETARRVFKHNYNADMHELIALLSIQGSNFVSDLPWYDVQGNLQNPDELPVFMKPLLTDDQQINEARLAARIEELRLKLRGY